MIKKWNEFIREFVENSDSLIDIKMTEIKELIDSVGGGHNLLYEWQNKNDHEIIINFNWDDLSIRYEFNIDNMNIIKIVSEQMDFQQDVDSIDEALDIIEKDIHNIIGISEAKRGRPKAGRTKSGRKVPGKYLTKNRKLMKKEIEEFQGKDTYKKDWDADYKSGKGGKGKRHETKKSAATIAYQKKYGKK
jgi:hypothetical protein